MVSQKSRFSFSWKDKTGVQRGAVGGAVQHGPTVGKKPTGLGRRRRSKNCPLPTDLYTLSSGMQQSVLNLSLHSCFPTHFKPIHTALSSCLSRPLSSCLKQHASRFCASIPLDILLSVQIAFPLFSLTNSYSFFKTQCKCHLLPEVGLTVQNKVGQFFFCVLLICL